MTLARQVAWNGWQTIIRFVQRVNATIGSIAQPSLTQLVLRIGLATPFWRSGINKWDGFLQLNIGLPSGVHGTVPVVVSVGGIPTPATATLAVQ